MGKANQISRFLRTKTSKTLATKSRANRTAAGLGDRTETRNTARHGHADGQSLFTLDANAVGRRSRASTMQKRGEHLEQLLLVDRTTAEFEIDDNMVSNRCAGTQRLDVLGMGIDKLHIIVDVNQIP